jgi:IS30 family transposase
MIRKEDFAVIKSLAQRGVFQKDIALELGVHPRTVSRALKRKGWLSANGKSRRANSTHTKPRLTAC